MFLILRITKVEIEAGRDMPSQINHIGFMVLSKYVKNKNCPIIQIPVSDNGNKHVQIHLNQVLKITFYKDSDDEILEIIYKKNKRGPKVHLSLELIQGEMEKFLAFKDQMNVSAKEMDEHIFYNSLNIRNTIKNAVLPSIIGNMKNNDFEEIGDIAANKIDRERIENVNNAVSSFKAKLYQSYMNFLLRNPKMTEKQLTEQLETSENIEQFYKNMGFEKYNLMSLMFNFVGSHICNNSSCEKLANQIKTNI